MLTTHYDRTDELPGFVEELVLDWLAAGLDPAKATIYRQSDIPEVAEMALLLGMITPLGWLERVPSYKERLRDMAERDVANFGLLGLPACCRPSTSRSCAASSCRWGRTRSPTSRSAARSCGASTGSTATCSSSRSRCCPRRR